MAKQFKYGDSHSLAVIERGYNEDTRFLQFHSEPLDESLLQEALDIIVGYNNFDSKIVGKVLLENFEGCRFVVGREYSVVIYVIPTTPYLFWAQTLVDIKEQAKIDEVAVNERGELRLWWD